MTKCWVSLLSLMTQAELSYSCLFWLLCLSLQFLPYAFFEFLSFLDLSKTYSFKESCEYFHSFDHHKTVINLIGIDHSTWWVKKLWNLNQGLFFLVYDTQQQPLFNFFQRKLWINALFLVFTWLEKQFYSLIVYFENLRLMLLCFV